MGHLQSLKDTMQILHSTKDEFIHWKQISSYLFELGKEADNFEMILVEYLHHQP